MASFFQQNEDKAVQAPQTGDMTTREQFAPPTGASTPGSAAKANTGEAVQGGGKAPAWTNLKSFLGAQDQGQRSAVAGKVTDEATKNADSAQAAGNKAAGETSAQIQSGTNKGGVFGADLSSNGAPPASPTAARDKAISAWQLDQTPYTGPNMPNGQRPPETPAPKNNLAALAPKAATTFKIGGSPLDGTQPPAPEPGGVSASDFNLDSVNLEGYQGPSAGNVAGQFGQAQQAAAKAADHANAGRSGKVAANAYDNAVATQTPVWASIRSALGGEQQAANRVNAQAAGGQEAVNQATATSATNAGEKKAQLKGIADTETAGATKLAADTGKLAEDLGKGAGSVASLEAAAANPEALKALGLSPQDLAALTYQAKNGLMSESQVQQALAPYLANAKKVTGYSVAGADKVNKINTKLSGSPGVAAVGNGMPGSAIDLGTATQGNQASVSALKSGNTSIQDDSKGKDTKASPQVMAAVKDLVDKGFSAEQISQMSGIPPNVIIHINNKVKRS